MQGTVPEVLGGFQLIERVATGGMASLYLGRRAGAHGFVKPVAIKVFHPDLADDQEFVDMFIDEAHILSRLNHPNIVHVEDLSEDQGFLFLVMEFVDGCPVRSLLRHARQTGKPLSVPMALHIICCAADGLHYAHEARDESRRPLGIVHRDVSPTNLLLSYDGHIKVIDFGIAKSAEQVHQTTFRRLKGKVAYMSPEQIKCNPIDRRSDIYSLGVILWEMLANRRAFSATDEIALVYEVSSKPLTPINHIRNDLPPTLVKALNAATARDVNERTVTTQEFRHNLLCAIPEVLTIQELEVGSIAQNAAGATGVWSPPHQRIRSIRASTTSFSSSSASFHSIAAPSPSKSRALEPAKPMQTVATSFSDGSISRIADTRVLGGMLLGLTLGIFMLLALLVYHGQIGFTGDLASMGGEPKNQTTPLPPVGKQPNTAVAKTLEKSVPTQSPVPAGNGSSAPAFGSVPASNPDYREVKSRQSPRQGERRKKTRRQKQFAGQSYRRTTPKRKTRPQKAQPPSSATSVVDDVFLANPSEIRLSRPKKRNQSGDVEAITEGDILLADEYQ